MPDRLSRLQSFDPSLLAALTSFVPKTTIEPLVQLWSVVRNVSKPTAGRAFRCKLALFDTTACQYPAALDKTPVAALGVQWTLAQTLNSVAGPSSAPQCKCRPFNQHSGPKLWGWSAGHLPNQTGFGEMFYRRTRLLFAK